MQALKEQVEEYEEQLIKQALQQCTSIRKAAKVLQIDQSTLVRKMQKYKMKR